MDRRDAAPDNEGGPPVGLPYAYQWFVERTPDMRHRSAKGIGSGGRVLYVVPDLRLVVAIAHARAALGGSRIRMHTSSCWQSVPDTWWMTAARSR